MSVCKCFSQLVVDIIFQKYYNAALAKHRTQSRGKQRDKRAVL